MDRNPVDFESLFAICRYLNRTKKYYGVKAANDDGKGFESLFAICRYLNRTKKYYGVKAANDDGNVI